MQPKVAGCNGIFLQNILILSQTGISIIVGLPNLLEQLLRISGTEMHGCLPTTGFLWLGVRACWGLAIGPGALASGGSLPSSQPRLSRRLVCYLVSSCATEQTNVVQWLWTPLFVKVMVINTTLHKWTVRGIAMQSSDRFWRATLAPP